MVKKVPFSKIKRHKFFRFENKLWQKINPDQAQVVTGKNTGMRYRFSTCTLVIPVNAKIVVEKQ
jgi:hypothetical protein